jgi:hypothetical protein
MWNNIPYQVLYRTVRMHRTDAVLPNFKIGNGFSAHTLVSHYFHAAPKHCPPCPHPHCPNTGKNWNWPKIGLLGLGGCQKAKKQNSKARINPLFLFPTNTTALRVHTLDIGPKLRQNCRRGPFTGILTPQKAKKTFLGNPQRPPWPPY